LEGCLPFDVCGSSIWRGKPGEDFKKRKKVEDFLRKTLAFLRGRCYNLYDLRVCFTRERGFPPLFLIEKGRIL